MGRQLLDSDERRPRATSRRGGNRSVDRAAHRLGARVVVLHPGVPSSLQSDPRDNRVDAAIRSVEELHAVAEPLGVGLALEVIPNQIADAPDLVGLIEDRLELSGVGICLDTGHALILGDVADAVEAASGHLVTTHLHDNKGKTDDHLLPFQGAINWPSVLMAFRKVGYDGVWMFELAALDAPRRVLEQAQQARKKMEKLDAAACTPNRYALHPGHRVATRARRSRSTAGCITAAPVARFTSCRSATAAASSRR